MRLPQTPHKPLALALLIAAAPACLAPHALEERPEDAELLRGQIPEAWTRGEAGDVRVETPFWETFDDEILTSLVEEALVHNHDLAASAERVRAAAARSTVARAARRPTLDANASYLRQKNVFVGFPIPGSTGVLSNQFSQWSASFDLAWEVDLWGKLAASASAADREFEATYADLQGARLSVAAQVTRAWFQLREAREQEDLAQDTLATFTRNLEVVRARNEAGLVGRLDVALSEANVASSRSALVAAERARASAARQVELLLGRYPAAELAAAGTFESLPPAVPVGVPAGVLERRPDLFAAERRVAAAESIAKAARLDRWPNLVLTASAGRTSDELDDLLDGDFSVWSFAGQLVGPIIDGGRRRARIDESLADLLAARSSFASAALRAFFEVESALDSERLVRERITHLEEAVRASTEATDLAEAQYVEGLIAIDVVLESQRREITAQSTLIAAHRELFQSRVDLHVALGGSFDSRIGDRSEVIARDDDGEEPPSIDE